MCSATTGSLMGMLTGRFLVGIGMGLGPAVAALYVAEVHEIYHFSDFMYAVHKFLSSFH